MHLDARIDAFLTSFAGRLDAMTDAEFEENRSALLALKMLKVRRAAVQCASHSAWLGVWPIALRKLENPPPPA